MLRGPGRPGSQPQAAAGVATLSHPRENLPLDHCPIGPALPRQQHPPFSPSRVVYFFARMNRSDVIRAVNAVGAGSTSQSDR